MTSRSSAGLSLIPAIPFLLSMVPGQALAQVLSFGGPREFPVGIGPNGVASGDFNGDGVADLAVAATGTNSTVSVLLGNGDGTFGAERAVQAGSSPHWVTTGEFNGDGLIDLATANFQSNDVSVLLGNGNGNFQSPRHFAAGLNPAYVAARDVSGDGRLDLISANYGSGTLSVLLGNGSGGMGAATTIVVGANPHWLAVSDLDGDGRPDLAAANFGSDTVQVLPGNGDGTFQAGQTYATGQFPVSVLAADFSGDGTPDLVVPNHASSDVSVLLGNGDGTFEAAQDFPTAPDPWGSSAADFNGDGELDLAVSHHSFGSAHHITSVFLGNGNGTFQPAVTVGPGDQTVHPLPVDVDGDGALDLAIANFSANTVSVVRGNGNGSFRTPRSFGVGINPISAAVGDFNGDGRADLGVGAFSGSEVSVLLGTGTGSFATAATYATESGPYGVTARDVNGDGVLDLIAANNSSQSVSVLRGNGNGTFQAALNIGVGGFPTFVAAGDVSGDGRVDLAVTNSGENSVAVLLGNGDGTFQAAQMFQSGSNPWSLAMGDLTGDGRVDLAVANRGANTVSVLPGNGNGTFQTAMVRVVGTTPNGLALGQFNGDGQLDLAVANFGNNNVGVLLGNGNGTFGAMQTYGVSAGPFSVTVGDVDGDGAQDLAVGTSVTTSVSVLLGNGNGTFETASRFGAGDRAMVAAIADFNGDSRADLALPIYHTDSVSVLLGEPGPVPTVATPVISPAAGTYTAPVTVTITDSTPGAVIHYTTDGSTPTPSSPVYSGPFAVSQTTTVKAMARASGMANSRVASAAYTIQQQQVATPVISPAAGTYITSVTVSITDSTPGAVIRYTVDGSTPTPSSPVYTGPFAVTQSRTVKAMATASGMSQSDVASTSYTIKVATPTISPASGTYNSAVTVTMADSTPGAVIHYTTNGSTPTPSSPVYTGPFTISQTTTVRAIGISSGLAQSDVASAAYTIQLQQVATPVISPAAGTYVTSVTVSITDSTPGAVIHYTIDGSTPTPSSPVYTGTFAVTQSRTVKAMATASGMANSNVASTSYTIKVATPSLSPAGGTFSQALTVTVGLSTSGAEVHYTTDGSTPTASSPLYTGPISVTQTTTVKAIGTKSGLANSDVVSATYTLRAATPTFNPGGGNYLLPQLVSISTATPGATIRYTLDGSTPTTSSPVYSGPILLVLTTTVKAIAVKPGWSQSTVGSATYNFLL